MSERISPMAARALRAAAVVIVLVIAGMLGAGSGNYYANIAVLTALAIVLALGVRLLMLAGEASMCHGTFYALGAYTVGILTTRHGLPFWATIPLGGITAALGAVLIGVPSLRTTGAYFFLMTFGFLVVVNSALSDWTSLTGGVSGIVGIPGPPGIAGPVQWFYVTGAFAVVSIIIFLLFERSRWGLQLRALGDSRDLAQSVGVRRLRNM